MPDAYIGRWAVHSMVSAGPLNDIMTAQTTVKLDLSGISTRLRNIVLEHLREDTCPNNWSKSGHLWHSLAAAFGFGGEVYASSTSGYFSIPEKLYGEFETVARLMGGQLSNQGPPNNGVVMCWWSSGNSKQLWGSTMSPLMVKHNIPEMYQAGRDKAIEAIISQQTITLTAEIKNA